jgi:hypothetical protein
MTNNKQQTAVDFVPYELALELKQLGFDEPCFGVYATKDGYVRKSGYDEIGNAPTYSQAFRFFREKYKLKCCIIPLVCEQGYSDLYESRIHQEKHSISRIGNYKIYEEAELACLKKLIEIVKTYGGGEK